jgi:hypothetical protein
MNDYDGPLLQTWVPRVKGATPDGLSKIAEETLFGEFDLDLDSTYHMVKPDIEGTYAFDKIWRSNSALLNLILDRNKMWTKARSVLDAEGPPPADTLGVDVRAAFYTLHALQKAHPITVDPQQIDVIPPFESWEEAFDYGNHVRLPFNCVFLDCELPTRISVEDRGKGAKPFEFIGALLAIEEETLIIVPFGRTQEKPTEKINVKVPKREAKNVREWDVDYAPLGAVVINLADTATVRDDEAFTNQTHFSIQRGSSLGLSYSIWRTTVSWFEEQLRINQGKQNNEHEDELRMDFDWKPEPGSLLDSANIILYPHDSADEEPDVRAAMAWASMNMIAAGIVLKILFFLDTPNIEIGHADVSRQVRRAAERRGAKISQTVWVKHNQKRSQRDGDAESEHIDYSHQFEVRGHWKYYPEGTKTADARPDLLRYVPGRGLCRKIWCPPFVKGPEDKPLVLKTRRVREEESP